MKVTFHKANNGEWLWTVQDTKNWCIIGRSFKSYEDIEYVINNFEVLTGRVVGIENAYIPEDEGGFTESWEVHFE